MNTQSLTKEFLVKEYLVNKRSFADIAKQLGTYPNKIRRQAILMGIEPRDKKKAQTEALKSGRHKHPTKGTKRNSSVKEKISESMGKVWEKMDKKERSRRSDIGKEQWNEMSVEKRKEFHKRSHEAIRKSSKEGSKLEKYLLGRLTEDGFRVDFHKEHAVVNERLQIDLFLPELNVAIEVDGPSHFKPVWGEDALAKTQKSDAQKNGLLISRGTAVIRVRQEKCLSQKYQRDIYKKLSESLSEIKKGRPSTEDTLYIEIGDAV